MSFILDDEWLAHFSKNYWEKKPLVFNNISSPLNKLGEQEIFELLIIYSSRCRKFKNADGFKFYVNGEKMYEADVLQMLPVKSDKSLIGYHKRMQKIFSDYCLVCDELLSVNTKYQSVLTEFTNKLYKHVGFPNRFCEMGLYLGNYKKTPFGVHVDSCGVFSFPVVGQKRFRLWNSDFIKKNPKLNRAFTYAKYKKNSQLLTVNKSDVSYWPSSSWHIAESSGEFSAAWSLGIWVDQPHKNIFTDVLSVLLHKKLGLHGNNVTTVFQELNKPNGEVVVLPEDFKKSLAVLQKLSNDEVKKVYLKSWMQHISMQGFKSFPNTDFKVSSNSKIKLASSSSKILWQKASHNSYHFSFAGALIDNLNSNKFLQLVKALNAGNSCAAKDYIMSKKDLQCLQVLTHAGAFTLIN